jgi:lysine biosynthesis protein LysW
MWPCTECDLANELDPDVEEGGFVICIECGAEFTVVKLDPLKLELLEMPVAVDADPDGEDDAWDDDE